jgi:Tol biopolymer transport system component
MLRWPIVFCTGIILLTVPAASQNRTRTISVNISEGTSLAIALSPDRRTIAFDLQGSLWTMPVTGGTASRITDEYYDARQPVWSPDGRTLAFQSYRDGTWRIWTIAVDGSNPMSITSGPFDDREPHWSPDGTRIAFSSDRSGNYDIWVLDLQSRQITQVTRDPGDDFAPTWSPDSRDIAFVSTRAAAPGVYAVSPRGDEKLIAAVNGTAGAPSWTTDGLSVVYSVTSGGAARLLRGTEELVAGEDVFPFRVQWLSANELL